MSRQQRRAAERAAAKEAIAERVHGRVSSSRTVQDIWRIYRTEVLQSIPDDMTWPLEQAFYSGAAAMKELFLLVTADESMTEDQGAANLQRLEDELLTWSVRTDFGRKNRP